LLKWIWFRNWSIRWAWSGLRMIEPSFTKQRVYSRSTNGWACHGAFAVNSGDAVVCGR
jgi:hypothetical protein